MKRRPLRTPRCQICGEIATYHDDTVQDFSCGHYCCRDTDKSPWSHVGICQHMPEQFGILRKQVAALTEELDGLRIIH